MFHRFATAIAVTTTALALFCCSAMAATSPPDAYEPNDTPAAAVGPLVGGQTYEGGIHSATDRDYFYFNTAGPGNYSVSIVDYGYPWSYCRKDWVALTAGGDLLDYETSWGSGDIYGGQGGSSSILSVTTNAAAKIYVRVQGEPTPYCWQQYGYWGPDKYTITALPAGAIVPSLPAPAPPAPSQKCVAAKIASSKAATQIKKLKKSISKASGKAEKRLKAKLAKTKTKKAAADKAVKKYC